MGSALPRNAELKNVRSTTALVPLRRLDGPFVAMVKKYSPNGGPLMAAHKTTTFKAGNRAAATHGLRSKRIRTEQRQGLFQVIRDQVVTRWPHLGDQEPLLSLLIDALADIRQARDWLNVMGGPISAGGRPYRALEVVRTRERDARDLCGLLLIAPRDMAKLGAGFGLTTPRQKLAEIAHAQLREKYAPDAPQ
jgi:hypothetical protein